MPERAFPVVYATDVGQTAWFWQRLGFEPHYQFPDGGEPGYVGLRRGASELGVTAADWPRQRYGLAPGRGPRYEMYVYVADVDALVAELRGAGVPVLAEPDDLPWGERLATVADPDGNPVALCNERAG